jgi:hypothetical protein
LVAKHLSELSVEKYQSQKVPRVSIRLQFEQGHSPERLARAVAAKIGSSLGNR